MNLKRRPQMSVPHPSAHPPVTDRKVEDAACDTSMEVAGPVAPVPQEAVEVLERIFESVHKGRMKVESNEMLRDINQAIVEATGRPPRALVEEADPEVKRVQQAKFETGLRALYAFRERKECGPLEQKMLAMMERHHYIMPTRMDTMCHVLLGNGTGVEWEGNSLVGLDVSGPNEISKEYAEQLWGWSHLPGRIPGFVKWAPLFNIPEGASDEAKMLCQEFIDQLRHLDEEDYKDFVSAKWWEYRRKNTTYFDQMVSGDMKAFTEVRSAARETAAKMEWTWLL